MCWSLLLAGWCSCCCALPFRARHWCGYSRQVAYGRCLSHATCLACLLCLIHCLILLQYEWHCNTSLCATHLCVQHMFVCVCLCVYTQEMVLRMDTVCPNTQAGSHAISPRCVGSGTVPPQGGGSVSIKVAQPPYPPTLCPNREQDCALLLLRIAHRYSKTVGHSVAPHLGRHCLRILADSG